MTKKRITASLGAISLVTLVTVLNLLSDNGYKVVPKSHPDTVFVQAPMVIVWNPDAVNPCARAVYSPGPGQWGLYEPGASSPFETGVVADPDTGLYLSPNPSTAAPDTGCKVELKRLGQ
jgi:hypothetical protein